MKYLLLLLIFANNNFLSVDTQQSIINRQNIAVRYYGNDHQWYQKNIPFFECSDEKLEEVYYYRWKLLKSHLRNLGEYGYVFTEFLNEMKWDLKPYNTINCATAFHIYEARWLKNNLYNRDYINFMYKYGGNDRHFTEAIADAAYSDYLVNPDKKFITSQLHHMISIYNAWDDHYDKSKQLYYSEPINDATEYTISSIDASGGRDGFKGGDSFRPSINSYMYANAIAIKNIALLDQDTATAKIFEDKAANLKNDFQKKMWHPQFRHFTDRYKVDNEFVNYWDFIRGRELVGFVPWVYNLPDDNTEFNSAWKHVMDTAKFNGQFGLRTVEPSYEYYMKQYRYDKATGLRECQWNGPSWPYQTTQVLMAMANVLNNYRQDYITASDYVDELRTYASQHYFKDSFNLLENYNPDKNEPIVYINERSEHYNHSGFNNLIISGFCGLRPRADDILEINPLITNDIIFFCLEDVEYQGHLITILYDRTGKKYNLGKGLNVYVDGEAARKLSGNTYWLGKPTIKNTAPKQINLAVNIKGKGYPKASASYTNEHDNVYMAIDGRIWSFENVRNRWSNYGSKNKSDWYEIQFIGPVNINTVQLFFCDDQITPTPNLNYRLEYFSVAGRWHKISKLKNTKTPQMLTLNFKNIEAQKIKIVFNNEKSYSSFSEIEIYNNPYF